MESILQPGESRHICLLCAAFHDDWAEKHTEEHHVYPGRANRAISEANGFKVYLCVEHHRTGKEAAHRNAETMKLLQQLCQKKYEQTHTREEFIELIGRSYL